MNPQDVKDKFHYWIRERESIRRAKEEGLPKPWSLDKTFQTTYFCNVRREDDRVTRWIRSNWSPDKIGWDNYEYAMVLGRFLNWPDTLKRFTSTIRTAKSSEGETIQAVMKIMADAGLKVWGNAYVVTTHGLPMGKAAYLCQRVLPAAYERLGAGRWRGAYSGYTPSLAVRHDDYMQLEGMGSFMSAQVLADLKNTKGHPLQEAKDWVSWSAPGPGSLRGLGWYFNGSAEKKVSAGQYDEAMRQVYAELPPDVVELLGGGMQDLQNCLCEFDKFMRVSTGTGRSKRGYPGK